MRVYLEQINAFLVSSFFGFFMRTREGGREGGRNRGRERRREGGREGRREGGVPRTN